MPSGLQVFDEITGSLMLDSSYSAGRLVGTQAIGFSNGSLIADLSTGRPFAFAVVLMAPGYTSAFGTPGGGMNNPIVTATSTGVSWVFNTDNGYAPADYAGCRIFYGVY